MTESINLSQGITYQTKDYKGGVILCYFYLEKSQSTRAKLIDVCWTGRVARLKTEKGEESVYCSIDGNGFLNPTRGRLFPMSAHILPGKNM